MRRDKATGVGGFLGFSVPVESNGRNHGNRFFMFKLGPSYALGFIPSGNST